MDSMGDVSRFAAIDFETANLQRSSACAVGVVLVEDNVVVEVIERLIRPPSRQFTFTYVHGLTWSDVEDAPEFAEVWEELAPRLDGMAFLAAHNAGFDRSVLRACCELAALDVPKAPFVCTVQMAKRAWGLKSARLPLVCDHLDIELDHHNAASDAEACARIVVAARSMSPPQEIRPMGPPRKKKKKSGGRQRRRLRSAWPR